MFTRLRSTLILVAATAGLSGCVGMDPYGYGSGVSIGYGSGYSPYGYGSYGYGNPYGAYGYGSSYGYGSPYYGWYDDFYYPGTGYYVYNRSGSRYRWSDAQRRYWEQRRGDGRRRDNWSGYRTPSDAVNAWTNGGNPNGVRTDSSRREYRQERRQDNRGFRVERRADRQAARDGSITREQFRTERREARQERRSDRSEARQERRSSGIRVRGDRRATASE